jgi:hypothetical protein
MSSKLTRVLKAPDVAVGDGRAQVRAILECGHNQDPTVAVVLEKAVIGAGPGDPNPYRQLSFSPKEVVDLRTEVRGIIEHASILAKEGAEANGFEQVDCYVDSLDGKLRIFPDHVNWGEIGVTTTQEAVDLINLLGTLVEGALHVPTMYHSVTAFVSHY